VVERRKPSYSEYDSSFRYHQQTKRFWIWMKKIKVINVLFVIIVVHGI
jgi:hypothetical protein